jgi:hypothetical protein
MGEGTNAGLGSWTFGAAIAGITGLVAVQSTAHLYEVLRLHRIGTLVDLDRSNGLPDVVSTLALLVAVVGAVALARHCSGRRELEAWSLAALLVALAVADALHEGPHPSAGRGWSVIALVFATGVLLGLVARGSGRRPRATIVVAGVLLVGSFLVNGLDRASHRFERERGDRIAEYQIVAKEGLELLGWSLVALALWDEMVRCRRAEGAPITGGLREQWPGRDGVRPEADSDDAGADARPLRAAHDRPLDVV